MEKMAKRKNAGFVGVSAPTWPQVKESVGVSYRFARDEAQNQMNEGELDRIGIGTRLGTS